MKKIAITILFLTTLTLSLSAQNIDMKRVKSEEDLRWGVVAFNNGHYNKAVQSLEKSLALKPDNPVTLMWLGRSYYMSGMEDAALAEWEKLSAKGEAGASLLNFSELVRYRQLLPIITPIEEKWSTHMKIPNLFGSYTLFNRPTSVRPVLNGSGSIYLVSYGSGQVLLFDANGARKNTFDGGLEGYSMPYDLLPLENDRFLLSEFGANRVSLCDRNGIRQLEIGSRGIGDGQLLGPMYLADGGNSFFVGDTGNRRIVKFDKEGNFILNMGRRSATFSGMSLPGGMVFKDGELYVLDILKGSLELFDESGNHLKTLIDKGLDSPEAIYFFNDNLLITDGDKILLYEIERDYLRVFSDLDGKGSRITSIDSDGNGNLLLSDYGSNKIDILSPLSSIYGGLFVRINRINGNSFPHVNVDLSVEKRDGTPIVGLDIDNFTVRENGRSVSNLKLEYASWRWADSSAVLLVEASKEMEKLLEPLSNTIKTFVEDAPKDLTLSSIAIGETPYLASRSDEVIDGNVIEDLTSSWYENWNPDLGIRLAASQLIPGRDKRSVIFVTTGSLPYDSFERYDIVELASYYRNNNISFHTVYTTENFKNEELEYLSKLSGGISLYMFQPRGLEPLMKRIKGERSGIYTLSYDSLSRSDFGRSYIPVELETVYIKRSGRDELAYYPPLQ